MKMVYVIQGNSTGINGSVIHWVDSAYVDNQKAIDECNAMNCSIKDDPNYLAYIVGPIPLY